VFRKKIIAHYGIFGNASFGESAFVEGHFGLVVRTADDTVRSGIGHAASAE
jgi:hypothetical protein